MESILTLAKRVTAEQQSALALDHHIVVHANAGAGKTRVLVERFIAIVRSGNIERIEQIVATTFTIKAAAEMRSRIRARLLELTEKESDEKQRTRLLDFAENIGAARITTLHSFCASLLRKYSYASGIDVDAHELSQRRANQWRSDALRATIRMWLRDDENNSDDRSGAANSDNSSRRERLLLFLDDLDVYSAEETIRELMISSERREHLATMFEHGDEAVAAAWRTQVNNVAKRTALRLLTHAQSELQRLQTECGANVQEILESNDVVFDALRRAESDDVLHVVQRVKTRLDKLYVQAGTPHKTKAKKLFDECAELAPLPKKLWESLQSFATDAPDVGFERQLRLVRTSLEIAKEASEAYTAMKAARNAIDFDDMMNLTRTMLQRPEIAADVQRGIRFLMVDEFQDTSPVQYHILTSLVPDLAPDHLSGTDIVPTVNLFIVGDAKQSIYGFRGADVQLFLQATRDIVHANRRNGSPDGRVVLPASYRMSPNLLPVVNGICEPVFAKSTDDISYTSLTGGREGAGALQTGTCVIVRTNTATPDHDTTAFSSTADDDDESVNTTRLDIEMRHVVQRIVRMLDNPAVRVGVRDDAEATRLAGPGDVAILVRTGEGVMSAGAALRDAGIPFQTHSGRSFFSRPEVADVRNLLLWCTDTNDDLAFSALVRSPLVLLYDADIVRIAAQPTKGSLWQRMNALLDADQIPASATTANVRAARSMMQRWTTAVHVLAPTDFVQRVLAESDWYSTLPGDQRRKQILLNIEKILELILAEQEESNASLRDIIMTLTPPAKDMEGDRPFAADPDAVQVMTLHAAKGLEFPIVALANIASRVGGSSSTAWSDEIGVSFSSPKKIITFDSPAGEAAPTDMLHTANRSIGEGAGADEDRRLLYVGLTRARDHLLISMPYEFKKATASKKDASIVVAREEKATAGLATLIAGTLADVPCTVVESDDIVVEYQSSIVASPILDVSAPLQASSWLDLVTATDLLSHSLDEGQDRASGAQDGVHADHGPAYGTLMHDVLQRVVQVGPVSKEERSAIIDSMLSIRLAALDAHTLARSEISSVMDSAFVQTHVHLLAKASVETTLLAALDSTVLQGMMDVRFAVDATTMEVWDWKTNIVKSEADIASLASAYAPQAQAYAWLCLQSFPEVQTVRTRLLFTKAAQSLPESWVVTQEWTREMSREIEASIVNAVHAIIARRRKRSGMFYEEIEVNQN